MYETAVSVVWGMGTLGLSLLLPLFSRIRPDRILDNYTRGQVHGYILANPGDHYSSIRDALGLNNGTLAYHLKRLEDERLVKSAADGSFRRYYPAMMKVPEPPQDGLTEVQRSIVSRILLAPGLSQSELGRFMGLSRATINYHMERLVSRGVLRRERAGMRCLCFVTEAWQGMGPGGSAPPQNAGPVPH